jgi:outer membrane lipase/esterase
MRKLALSAAALLCLGVNSGARAEQAGTIFAFGDSLLDVSRNCPVAFPQSAPYGACGNGRGTVQWLSQLTQYSFSKPNDYAYNGVGNGVFPAFNGGPTVADQVVEFTSAGRSFQSNDLVVVGGMPNNAAALFLGIPDPNGAPYTPQTLAVATLSQQYGNISNLIKAGGRNFLVENSFSSSTHNFYTIGGFYPFGPPYAFPDIPGATTFFGLVNANLAATLAPLAAPGVRIRVVDLAAIYTQAYTNPKAYGFTTGTSCVFDPGCLTASAAVQNQHFMYDLHPTDAGYALIARYEANLLGAQDGLAAQGDIAQIAAMHFSNSIFSRLDAFRTFGFAATGAASQAYASMNRPGTNGAFKAAPRVAPEMPFSVYLAETYGNGSRGDRLGDAGNATGFRYNLHGGTIGADYKFDPNLRVGAAFSYTNPNVALNGGTGNIHLNSYQAGGFVSLTYPNLFADFVATYGRHAYDIDRPGVIDTIKGHTNGDTFTLGAKSAYLFDAGIVRVGPLGGLLYSNVSVDPYTETGDPIITQAVARQRLEGLTGSAGVQLRIPFVTAAGLASSFVNLTAEHDFLGGARTLLSAETVALALPIYTVVPGASQRTYAKLEGGLSAALFGNVSGMLTGATTFGGGDGPNFAVQGALKIAF